jgi:hypothetical protein
LDATERASENRISQARRTPAPRNNFRPDPQVFVGVDASIGIPALGINLRLSDIYSGINFD